MNDVFISLRRGVGVHEFLLPPQTQFNFITKKHYKLLLFRTHFLSSINNLTITDQR